MCRRIGRGISIRNVVLEICLDPDGTDKASEIGNSSHLDSDFDNEAKHKAVVAKNINRAL